MQDRHVVEERFRTTPLPGWECRLDAGPDREGKVPALLRAYLSLGAKVCGPPAIDRAFGTIDFLTWMDLEAMDVGAKRMLA
jgi:putative hemolysin